MWRYASPQTSTSNAQLLKNQPTKCCIKHSCLGHIAALALRWSSPSPLVLTRPTSFREKVLLRATADPEGEQGQGPRKQPSNSNKQTRWGGLLKNINELGNPKFQTPLRILFNAAVLYALMRLWPAGGRGLDQMVVDLPFSEFVKSVRSNEVQTVSFDGMQINYRLRPDSPLLQQRKRAGADGSTVVSTDGSCSSSSGSIGSSPAGSPAATSTSVSPSTSIGSSASDTAMRTIFTTMRPEDYPVPYDLLERHGVSFTAVQRNGALRELSQLLPLLVAYGLGAAVLLALLGKLPFRQQQKSSLGKRFLPGGDGSTPAVTFADVAGVDEAKEELAEVVEFLRSPSRFTSLGARPPSGVLLVGPPGTGKTLLAKAVAGEAGVPFFSVSASEFVELYVGMGASRVRQLFEAARKEAPAIVFIDEIDAVAKGRDARVKGAGAGNDEREQTLNQLLTELDGFDTGATGGEREKLVIVLAATNRPDVLDQALLRPGRFDRRVSVERPDRMGREHILSVHIQRRGLPLAPDVHIPGIASLTTGFTGADLANLVNEAALLGGRASKSSVGMAEFDAAILRAIAGVEKKRSILQGSEKLVVARHEVGHALVGAALSLLQPATVSVPEKLSIVPRSGGALGFTYTPPPDRDRALMFDAEVRGQLAVLMGGRAAEHLTCGAVSTGASDDIQRATDLAYKAVTQYGLSPAVGPINVASLCGGGEEHAWILKDGGEMGRLVESEVRALLEAALALAMGVITHNSTVHAGLSEALLATERVEGEELKSWLDQVTVPDAFRSFVLEGRLPQPQPQSQLHPAGPSPSWSPAAVAA